MMTAYSYAILAAFFWGAGFIGSRYGLEALSPMWVTFFRFLVAFLIGLPVLRYVKKADFNWKVWLGAFVSAIFLASMMFLQIKGLQYTTVAKSGFITILYAFFTPIICWMLYKKKLSSMYWALLGVALVGMMLICELSFDNFNRGDMLTLVCALISSFHIISIGHFTKYTENFALFNLMQMFFVCTISLPLAYLLEGSQVVVGGHFLSSTSALSGILFMGVFSTSIAFFLQGKSQQKIPPHMASLIFLLESPFAAILGYLIFNEIMSQMAIMGCLLVTFTVALLPMEDMIKKSVRTIRLTSQRWLIPKIANYLLSLIICLLVI
jgi:drug/metabolite transporter (DMT)-like permease